jgi:hypothetical protein
MSWLEPGTDFTAHLTKSARWWRKHGREWYAAHIEERRAYFRAYQQTPERREYLNQKQREYRAKKKEIANGL